MAERHLAQIRFCVYPLAVPTFISTFISDLKANIITEKVIF